MTQDNETNPLAIIHIPQSERNLSLLGGGILTIFGVAFGLARRNPFGALVAALGGALIYRSVREHSGVYYLMATNPNSHSRPEPLEMPERNRQHVTAVITIDYPLEKLYPIWRDFQQVSRILSSIESVTVHDRTHSRWTAKPVDGFKMSWDVEITNEVPNKLISWESLGDSQIAHAGSIRFRPAAFSKGTEMRITLEYTEPEQPQRINVARWLGIDPQNNLQDDLERFKVNVEQGRFEPPYEPWVQPDAGQFRGQDATQSAMVNDEPHDAETLNRNM